MIKKAGIGLLAFFILGAIASAFEEDPQPDPLAAQLAETTTTTPPATPAPTTAPPTTQAPTTETQPESESIEIDNDELAVLAVASTIRGRTPQLDQLATVMIADPATKESLIDTGHKSCDLASNVDTVEQLAFAQLILWEDFDATTQALFGDESGFAAVFGALIGAFCRDEGERIGLGS